MSEPIISGFVFSAIFIGMVAFILIKSRQGREVKKLDELNKALAQMGPVQTAQRTTELMRTGFLQDTHKGDYTTCKKIPADITWSEFQTMLLNTRKHLNIKQHLGPRLIKVSPEAAMLILVQGHRHIRREPFSVRGFEYLAQVLGFHAFEAPELTTFFQVVTDPEFIQDWVLTKDGDL